MYPKLLVASKTFWVNLLTFLVAVLGLLQGQEWIADHPQAVSIVAMAVGGVNIVLRWLTDRPVVMSQRKVRSPPRGWR